MTEQLLELHNLSFVPEGNEVLVGRVETDSYAVFPLDGAELLHRIAEGMTLSQASAWYEHKFGEPVDVDEFAETLAELGFLRDPGSTKEDVKPVRLRRLGQAVFSPASWACYGLVVACWLLAVAHNRALLPRSSQVFFSGSLVAVQLVITFGQIPLLFLHEGFHILAGRRLGLRTRMSVSNRLTYIVFETRLNGVKSVPRRARYLPFLAGMLCDVVVLCSLGLIAELTRLGSGSFSITGRVCLALAFTVAVRLAWQFQLYLRTDLYYVFATALNCYDLHDASTALLRNRIKRTFGSTRRLTDEQQWTERDRQVGKLYGPFIVLGILAFIVITGVVTIPVVRQYCTTLAHGLASSPSQAIFWDALISLGFNVAQIVALIVLSRRKRRDLTISKPRLLQGEVA